MVIEALRQPSANDRGDLGALLRATVEGGASIGFLRPFPAAEIESYWSKVLGELAGGTRLILVARELPGAPIAGSAQLVFETRANGRHRAEVQKVMVLPSHRRRGIAAQLMRELESTARGRGVWLLFLDTSDSRAGARQFYEALGYVYAGGIPGYALDPDGTPEKNAIFYKTLAPGA
jgi:GNAT superfamily N-acetyltransferase